MASAGAHTLSGVLQVYCGILDLRGLDEPTPWNRVEDVFTNGYRKKEADWSSGVSFTVSLDKVEVCFIGVWETVGALGIPDDLAVLNLLDNVKSHTFHDTGLSPAIKTARHAVALDEKRASFAPTLWTKVPKDRDVVQLWFPGVYSDVGGGYPETGLSDGALGWMMNEAAGKGMSFMPGMLGQVRPNPQDVMHDSVSGVFKVLRTQPRSIPPLDEKGDPLHSSAISRYENPPITEGKYRPTRRLEAGKKMSLNN